MAPDAVLLTSQKFRVLRRQAPGTDGRTRPFDFIAHPGGAIILPLLDGERVVLIRNLRHTLGRELLELPAGTLDPPESPAECARRELEEETGYAAAELAPLLSFQTTPGFCDEVLHAFVATGLRKTAARCEPTERIEPVIMPLGEALGAVMDGRISDGKTIATLLYFERARRP